MFDLHKTPIGIYEKALPNAFSWKEKMLAAKKAGFDFIEISVDESDERLARLDWTDEEIGEVRRLMDETGIGFSSMCLSGHRRFPFGSKNPETRKKAYEIMEKGIILAQKLGIACIQLATYDVYYEESDAETEALFLQGMKDSVAMAAKAGVILAMEIMDLAVETLGRMFVSLYQAFNIANVVYGGDLVKLGNALVDGMIIRFLQNCEMARKYPVSFKPAKLGDQGIMLGAALLVGMKK